MGFIREPKEIDFIVDPTPLTKEDRKRISEIIAHYKATGRRLPLQKLTTKTTKRKRQTVSLNTPQKKKRRSAKQD